MIQVMCSGDAKDNDVVPISAVSTSRIGRTVETWAERGCEEALEASNPHMVNPIPRPPGEAAGFPCFIPSATPTTLVYLRSDFGDWTRCEAVQVGSLKAYQTLYLAL